MELLITNFGYKKLSDELDHLLKVERPEVVKVVSWAAGNGDRSENGDYIYGKMKLRQIDKRVEYLSKRLDVFKVITPENIKSDKIMFGASVTVLEDSLNKIVYTIVGSDEIDLDKNKISYISPIGKSLLGKSVDDFISIKIPKGNKDLEICKIEYLKIK